MNAPKIQTKRFHFSQLGATGRKNAIGLNFHAFVEDETNFFSENHQKLVEEVQKKREEWGMEALRFEINAKDGFIIKPGTISTDFLAVCTKLLKTEENAEARKAITDLKQAHEWSQKIVQDPTVPLMLNYRFKREDHKGIIPYGAGCEESLDIYVGSERRIKPVWQMEKQEKNELAENMKEIATQEEKQLLTEIQFKSLFEKDQMTRNLSETMTNILARKAKERNFEFEKYVAKKLKQWEQEIQSKYKEISFREELATYLLNQPAHYLFSESGWMKKAE